MNTVILDNYSMNYLEETGVFSSIREMGQCFCDSIYILKKRRLCGKMRRCDKKHIEEVTASMHSVIKAIEGTEFDNLSEAVAEFNEQIRETIQESLLKLDRPYDSIDLIIKQLEEIFSELRISSSVLAPAI